MTLIRRSDLNPRIRNDRQLHRGTPAQRGYDRDWKRVARERREADSWLCQPCLSDGRITASNEVDHIIPIHVRPDWHWSLGTRKSSVDVVTDARHWTTQRATVHPNRV